LFKPLIQIKTTSLPRSTVSSTYTNAFVDSEGEKQMNRMLVNQNE